MSCYRATDGALVTSDIHEAVDQDVDAAVAAARSAFPEWARMSRDKRMDIMLKFADVIKANADELARLEALCSVKPVQLFHGYELLQTVDIFRCKLFHR
jgi:acyl-CoA reductase-like NAD-dependent aldehyde dehydrogenase